MYSNLLYYTLLYFTRLKELVTRMSYRDFWHFCCGGTIIFSVLLFVTTRSAMSGYTLAAQLCYYAGYAVGIAFSHVVMEMYLQHIFRNMAGVVLTAVVLPAFIGMINWKIYIEHVDTWLMVSWILSIGLTISIWLLRQTLKMWGNLAKDNGLSAVIRFWIQSITRNIQLGKALKRWKGDAKRLNYAFSWLKPELWWDYSIEERIEYIEKTLAYELASLQLDKKVHIYSRTLGSTPVLNFRSEIDFGTGDIFWEKDAVHFFSPQRILKDILQNLNFYQWYTTLTAEEQHVVVKAYSSQIDENKADDISENGEMEKLLYQQLNKENWPLVYDILTGAYARTKADWYCGF